MSSTVKRPNVLVCMTDSHTFQALGCAGNPVVRTPHLDALAREGMRFEQAYASSAVCTPSRTSMMTGRHHFTHGVTDRRGRLSPEQKTLGSLFSEAGYRTGYFGKPDHGRGKEIQEEGWDTTFLIPDYNQKLKEWGIPCQYPKDTLEESHARYWKIGSSIIPYEQYFEKVLGDQAIAFIEQHNHQPTLCFLSMIAPHGPFSPPAPYDRMYKAEEMELYPRSPQELQGKPQAFIRWATQNQKYVNDEELHQFMAHSYGLISLADETIGRLVQTLKSTGLYDNTLILFCSDHGDFRTKYGMFGKSWSMDDVLVRIPMIISHPDYRNHGKVNSSLVSNLDVLPTLLETCGIENPEHLEGHSLLPLLSGEKESVQDKVFAFHSNFNGEDRLNLSMVRRGDWKLVQASTGENQLYNLAEDPHEWNNRIEDPALKEILLTLKEDLLMLHIQNAGRFRAPGQLSWEEDTLFYDETRFDGTRQVR